ncbi:MAG: alpha/beta hydrolase [Erythrobacter sp.]|nr:alpha/beta hydrolase [Erythrobacter sp.]
MLAVRSPEPDAVWHGEVAVAGGSVPIFMAGEGTPLILLHGWSLDHRMWRPQIADLAKDFFLVMPDRRGCGGATAPPDLAREAEDVIAIADFLGFDRFALAGLSRGAVVALDVARRHGSRITGLVVSGAPLPALVAREEVIDLDRFRTLAAAGDLERLRAEWSRHPLMETHSPAARALVFDILADYDGRDLLMPSDPPGFPREVLAMLAMPVLAMTGAHDTLWRRECARVLAAVAPRARHIEITGAGHLANADNPAAFNAAVASFLRSCAPLQSRPPA